VLAERDSQSQRSGDLCVFRHLFTELPKAETVEAIEALLSDNLNWNLIRID